MTTISFIILEDCMALKDAVLQYCALSGQAVNMGKSSVSFSSRLHHRHVRMLVRAMGIRRNLGVWTYLLSVFLYRGSG